MYSRRIPGLRARWLAFNEGVVLGQSSTEFRRCSILRFDTGSNLLDDQTDSESERRCAFRLGIVGTIGIGTILSTWIPYVNR